MNWYRFCVLLFAVCLGVFCTGARAQAVTLLGLEIDDLKELSQDPADYITDRPDVHWLSEEEQHSLADAALKKFLAPWRGTETAPVDMDWTLGMLDAYPWAANLNRWTPEAKEALLADADMEHYPNMDKPAIAVVSAAMRSLPTMHPTFGDPREAGEGFPFDMLQNHTLYVGTPLRVRHVNRRGDWYLCETPDVSGWVRSADIAFVGPKVIRRFRKGKYAVILGDGTPLRGSDGKTIAVAHTGALLPLSRGRGGLFVAVPVRTSDGTAKIVRAEVCGDAAAYPLPFTAGNMAAQARKFIGAPYGWGSLFEERDCSATMRDLFAPFGFALPRHSAAQARSGTFIDLSDKTNEEKLDTLRANGIPFRTMVGMKGHIGLFVGLSEAGEPLIMHNVWGVRLGMPNAPEQSGRLVIGRTVITTLTPGAERSDVSVENSMLARTETLTHLPAPE